MTTAASSFLESTSSATAPAKTTRECIIHPHPSALLVMWYLGELGSISAIFATYLPIFRSIVIFAIFVCFFVSSSTRSQLGTLIGIIARIYYHTHAHASTRRPATHPGWIGPPVTARWRPTRRCLRWATARRGRRRRSFEKSQQQQ
jgi:hypothetical protein